MFASLFVMLMTSTPALVTDGKALYETHCTSCHGANFAGGPGVPAIRDAGGSGVDFYLTTGRMPGALKDVQAVHGPPHFTAHEIAALDAYVDANVPGYIPIPVVIIDRTLTAHGRKLFEENCEACHGVAGQGATAGGNWTALPLGQATPTQIGEAIRYGPGVMPRFNRARISDRDIDALASYIDHLNKREPAYGGFTLDYLGPVAEGLIAAVFGIGGLFWVMYFTGTKADGSRFRKRS